MQVSQVLASVTVECYGNKEFQVVRQQQLVVWNALEQMLSNVWDSSLVIQSSSPGEAVGPVASLHCSNYIIILNTISCLVIVCW